MIELIDHPMNRTFVRNRQSVDKIYHEFGTTSATVFDVGANIGTYSLSFWDLGFQDVHAFEPVSGTRDVLEQNCRKNNSGVRIHPFGFGSESGTVTFRSLPTAKVGNCGCMSVHGSVGDPVDGEIRRLDDFCSENRIYPKILKIDVEGFEDQVLIGGLETISKHVDLLIIEVNPQALQAAGSDRLVIQKILETCGLKFKCKLRKMDEMWVRA